METNLNEVKQVTIVNVNELPMTMGQWLLTLLVLAIPVVNIVLLIVWATGHDVNRSKKTYCQATLIVSAIILVLYFLVLAPIMMNIMNSIY